MNLHVQAADMVIYRIHWGCRNEAKGLLKPTRDEVASQFALKLDELQHRGQGYRAGHVFNQRGIGYVRNPYGADAQ